MQQKGSKNIFTKISPESIVFKFASYAHLILEVRNDNLQNHKKISEGEHYEKKREGKKSRDENQTSRH